jgi:hypothetical protein
MPTEDELVGSSDSQVITAWTRYFDNGKYISSVGGGASASFGDFCANGLWLLEPGAVIQMYLFPGSNKDFTWGVDLRGDGNYGPDIYLASGRNRAPYPQWVDEAALGTVAMVDSEACATAGLAN